MATTQTIHGDSIKDTWSKKFPGRVFTVYPLDGNNTVVVTTADSVAALLATRPSANLYIAGTFTVPTTAVPTYSNITRRASYAPIAWTITCNASQLDSLQFSQYFILMDEALGSPKIHYISAALSPSINLSPSSTHTGATILEAA
jgi:hypothetical protein